MKSTVTDKSVLLFIILGGFFVVNALMAEFVGVKIFTLEETLGWKPMNFNLFGHDGSLNFSAGVILWPTVFVMTDVINEYYGKKGVRLLSFMTVGLISYGFLMLYAAISLTPADWWITSMSDYGVDDMQAAFSAIFGQGMWIIVGSLVAFLIGQILDVAVYHYIRSMTGEGKIWLRATGSTIISQFVDSFIVLYIAFVLGPAQWELSLMFAVGTVNYIYKFIMAIVLTPVIYFTHHLIDNYLGTELAEQLKLEAAN